MRAMLSYGLALLIILGVAAWLSTGTLVIGGLGAGEGETPIVSFIEGEDGPIGAAIEESGLAPHHETAGAEGDPALTIAQRQEAESGGETQLASVRTITSTAQLMPIEVPVRGRTRASATITAMPETSGIVSAIHVTKGQQVAAGDLLCTLDQGTRQSAVDQATAALAQAQASLAQAQADFETNADLRDRGLSPANSARSFEVQVAAAESAVAAALSGLNSASAELDRTEVHAKVAGIVQDPLANVGDMLGGQAPCATIVQLDPMLFTGSIPEAQIALARTGLAATVTTVTGQTVTGEVTYISSTADPATRTFAAEVSIPNANGAVLDGVTAEAVVNIGSAPAHLVPQSVLTLDENGVLGIRVVEDGIVAFYPVTIASDTREGVWVTGLPLTAEVITVGQEFVITGQPVDAAHAS